MFTGSPPKGKGSLEQSLKLLVEFSNKAAHGLASAPKYKGEGHTRAGQALKTKASCLWLIHGSVGSKKVSSTGKAD